MSEYLRRIEIISEESDYAAETDSYLLRLKTVKDFAPTGREGWMGSVYFRHETPPSFSANTDMKPTRDEAFTEGVNLMGQLQTELDVAVKKASQIIEDPSASH